MSMKYYSIMTDLKPNYLFAISIKSFSYISGILLGLCSSIFYITHNSTKKIFKRKIANIHVHNSMIFK